MYNILVCDDEKDIVSALSIIRYIRHITEKKHWSLYKREIFIWCSWIS